MALQLLDAGPSWLSKSLSAGKRAPRYKRVAHLTYDRRPLHVLSARYKPNRLVPELDCLLLITGDALMVLDSHEVGDLATTPGTPHAAEPPAALHLGEKSCLVLVQYANLLSVVRTGNALRLEFHEQTGRLPLLRSVLSALPDAATRGGGGGGSGPPRPRAPSATAQAGASAAVGESFLLRFANEGDARGAAGAILSQSHQVAACMQWLRAGLPPSFAFQLAGVVGAPLAELTHLRPTSPWLTVPWAPLAEEDDTPEDASSAGSAAAASSAPPSPPPLQWGALLPVPAAWRSVLDRAHACRQQLRPMPQAEDLLSMDLGLVAGAGPAALEVLLSTPAGLAVARIYPQSAVCAMGHPDWREVLAVPTAHAPSPVFASSIGGSRAGSVSGAYSSAPPRAGGGSAGDDPSSEPSVGGRTPSSAGSVGSEGDACYLCTGERVSWTYHVTTQLPVVGDKRGGGGSGGSVSGSDASLGAALDEEQLQVSTGLYAAVVIQVERLTSGPHADALRAWSGASAASKAAAEALRRDAMRHAREEVGAEPPTPPPPPAAAPAAPAPAPLVWLLLAALGAGVGVNALYAPLAITVVAAALVAALAAALLGAAPAAGADAAAPAGRAEEAERLVADAAHRSCDLCTEVCDWGIRLMSAHVVTHPSAFLQLQARIALLGGLQAAADQMMAAAAPAQARAILVSDPEPEWLTDDNYQRFMNAKPTLEASRAQARAAHQWRQSLRVDAIFDRPAPYFHYIQRHFSSFVLANSVCNGNVLLLMRVGMLQQLADAVLRGPEGPAAGLAALQAHLVLLQEYLINVAAPAPLPAGNMVQIYDLAGLKLSHLRGDAMQLAQALIKLGQYYPERLAQAIVVNPPSWVNVPWKLVSGFLDTATRSKVLIMSDKQSTFAQLSKIMGAENVPAELGGPNMMPLDRFPAHQQLLRFVARMDAGEQMSQYANRGPNPLRFVHEHEE